MSKKEYRKDDKAPSQMFEDSLQSGVGSADMECGWCGRLHLCPNNNYDPPDYIGLEGDEEACKNAFAQYCEEEYKKNPEGVVLHYDWDSVLGRSLNNINFVIGCPCNGLSRFETFIWAERATIREYLTRRVDQEYEWAEQEKTRNKLAGFENEQKKTFYY